MICTFCGLAFFPGEQAQCVNKPTTNKRPPVVVRMVHLRCLGRFKQFDMLQGWRSRNYWMGDDDAGLDSTGGVGTGDIVDD